MRDAALLGVGRHMIPVPRFIWRSQVSKSATRIRHMMTHVDDEVKAVRDVAVLEIVGSGQCVSAGTIADELDIPAERVLRRLDEAERRKVFLFRENNRDVQWAYPVTADATPHRLVFGTGETVNAA